MMTKPGLAPGFFHFRSTRFPGAKPYADFLEMLYTLRLAAVKVARSHRREYGVPRPRMNARMRANLFR